MFDPKNWKAGVAMAESLPAAVESLLQVLLKRRVPFAIAGGIAMLAHVPGRNTQDLDLLMAPADVATIPELEVLERTNDFVLASYRGLRVELLLTQNKLFAHILSAFVAPAEFEEGSFPCVTPQGLAILKLFALPSLYCQGDFARVGIYENDVATLLHEYGIDIEAALNELEPHLLSSDHEQVREIVDDLRQGIRRFEERAGPGYAAKPPVA